MSEPNATAAEAAPTNEPASTAPQVAPEPAADTGGEERWRAKYERADKHLNEKIEALKAQSETIATLEQKLAEANAAKAEAEANSQTQLEALQKQIQERDFQDQVLSGVAPGKLEHAKIMVRGLGIDPTLENAAELAAEQLRKVAPDLYASAPVRSASTEDTAMREGLKGKTWLTLSPDERRYVVNKADLVLQLNNGAISNPHPKEKHKR